MRTLADITDFSVVFMIGGGILAALIVFLTLGAPRKVRKRDLDAAGELQGELRETIAELEDLARKLSSELDQKTQQLEKLLAEADQKLAALSAPGSRAVVKEEREEEPELDPVAMKICAMAESGKQPLEIARELNEQIGKVELVLALRRQVRR